MPQGSTRSFADPDEYVAGVRATDLRMSITRPGTFTARAIRIDLHHLWMQRCFDSLPRVRHHNNLPGRAIFSFVPRDRPSLWVDGAEQSSATILRSREAASGFQRSTGPAYIASMSLPVAEIEALGATFGDADLTPPRDTVMTFPAAAAMEHLQNLHAHAGHLAQHAPELLARPEAAHALEQALIGALADCLADSGTVRPGCKSRHHAQIMRRLQAILEANPDRVFHLPEICRMLGISCRTLTTCCNEVLGMSPRRYFRLRQMHLAHRALKQADPATSTVTEIATGLGFWELGRFAVAYRELFGESPSVTLRRVAA